MEGRMGLHMKGKVPEMEIDAMVDAVRDYLDGEEYRYEYDAERNVIKLRFTIQSKLRNTNIVIRFKPRGILSHAYSPIDADKDAPVEMMKFLTMANYALFNGNFEMDLEDGEVRYKVWLATDGLETIPKEQIEDLVDLPIHMLKLYGDGIAALAMGFSDAETEIKKCEESN